MLCSWQVFIEVSNLDYTYIHATKLYAELTCCYMMIVSMVLMLMFLVNH